MFDTCYAPGMSTTEQGTVPEAPADRETKAVERTYIVLRRSDNEEGAWLTMGSAKASSDYQAIIKATGEAEAGTWVAIPQRNWNPRTRKLDPQPPKPVWS